MALYPPAAELELTPPSAYASPQKAMHCPYSFKRFLCLLAACAVLPVAVWAQGITFISVSASPGLVSFRLAPSGVAPGSTPVSLTTQWRLRRGNVITLYAYFTNPPAALSAGGASNIPSSHVSGTDASGRPLPFTGSGPFSNGASLTIFQVRIRGVNRRGQRTDAMSLQIDTTGLGL
ncbi:MAG TPA: hypothetical protein VGR03_12890, partial [Candidatus Acidoferrum sp.]|nr:hypothetical protein [Candidatus Acidoferrum sp.]